MAVDPPALENQARGRAFDLLKWLSVNHAFQPRDPLRHGRVGAEKILEPAAAKRIHDEHMSRGGIRVERNPLRSGVELP